MFLDPEGRVIEFASPECAGCKKSARCQHLVGIDRGSCPLAERVAPTRRFREDCKLPPKEEGLLRTTRPQELVGLVMGQ